MDAKQAALLESLDKADYVIVSADNQDAADALAYVGLVRIRDVFLRAQGGWRDICQLTREGRLFLITQRLQSAETEEDKLNAFLLPSGEYDVAAMYALLDGNDDLTASFKMLFEGESSNPLIAKALRLNEEKRQAAARERDAAIQEVLSAESINWRAASLLGLVTDARFIAS